MGDSIRVLHVDDEPSLTELSADFLEAEDPRFAVQTAVDASEGLEQLEDSNLDCVISDYDMPGKNGIEFLEDVREVCPDLPFILFTGKGSEEVASEAISAGVTDYLQKEVGGDQYKILANRILNYVERTQAQRERQRMRERMELALEQTDSIVFEIDLDAGAVLRREGDFEGLFHRSGDDIQSFEAYIETAVHPDDRSSFRRLYRELMDGDRQSGELEYRSHPDTGPTRWFKDTVFVNGETREEARTALGLARDVTERKEHVNALRKKERRYDAIFNDPNILVGLLNPDGTVLEINQTAMEYIDVSHDEVAGEPFWETPWFGHSASIQSEVRDWVDLAAEGEYVEFDAELERPNGTPYEIEGVVRPVMNGDSEVVSLIISDRDLTQENAVTHR